MINLQALAWISKPHSGQTREEEVLSSWKKHNSIVGKEPSMSAVGQLLCQEFTRPAVVTTASWRRRLINSLIATEDNRECRQVSIRDHILGVSAVQFENGCPVSQIKHGKG